MADNIDRPPYLCNLETILLENFNFDYLRNDFKNHRFVKSLRDTNFVPVVSVITLQVITVHALIIFGLTNQSIYYKHLIARLYKYCLTKNNTKSHKYFSYRNLKRFDHNKLVQTLEKPHWT